MNAAELGLSRVPAPAPRLFPIVLFGAVAGALGEYAVRTILGRWMQKLDPSLYLDPNALWMGPIANIAPYAVAVLLAAGLARLIRAKPWVWATWVTAFLVFVQPGLVSRGLLALALMLLAAGLATVVVRLAEPRGARVARSLRTLTNLLLAVTLGWAGLRSGYDFLRLRRARDVQAAASAGSPNVLLLILDTVRAASLGLYGNARPTSPVLDSLARRGIRFDHAIAPAPWTLPSHASLFTGRYPTDLVWGAQRAFGPEENTIAEHLTAAGYRTGGFVANTVYGSYRHGLSRGFQTYRDYPLSASQVLAASSLNQTLLRTWNRVTGGHAQLGAKNAERINRDFLGWVSGVPADRPWFAFLNYFDAHMPYAPPAPWDLKFLDHEPRRRSIHEQGSLKGVSKEEFRDFVALYDGAIAYLDSQLGALFRALEARGQLDNTIIVVTSDHGEAFGEHGFAEHGASLFAPEVHVPLIVRLPRNERQGCTVARTVSLRDVAATIAQGARLGTTLPGVSLLPLCGPDSARVRPSRAITHHGARTHLPAWYPASVGSMIGVYTDQWSYIRFDSGREDLFDRTQDPGQQRSVTADSAHRSTLEALRAVTDSALSAAVPMHQWTARPDSVEKKP